MKTRLFLIFVILFLTGSLYGQDYYMYVDGNKRYYKVSPDKILIQCFDKSVDFIKIKDFLREVNVNSRDIIEMYNGEPGSA